MNPSTASGFSHFNSRPSARGDLKKSATRWGRFGIFQFTPLREGRRGSPAKGNCLYISIHAPPRGATRERRWYTLSHIISIHAPPRGATGAWRSVPVARRRYFNSRPSARGDGSQRRERGRTANFNSRPSARGDYMAFYLCRCNPISIHAPPRGATESCLPR